MLHFVKLPVTLLADTKLTAAEKLFLAYLLSLAKSYRVVRPSNAKLSETLGLSVRHIQRIKLELAKGGYIKIEQRGRGTCSYELLRKIPAPIVTKDHIAQQFQSSNTFGEALAAADREAKLDWEAAVA